MAPNAHANILTDSIKPEELEVANLFDVSGRVAIVTGGGTGLGLVTAQALAQNGAKVYISGRRLEVLQKAASFKPTKGNGEIIAIQADLNSKEAILGRLVLYAQAAKAQSSGGRSRRRRTDHGVYLSDISLKDAPQTAEGLSKAALEGETFDSCINVTSVHFTTFAFLPLLAAAREVGGAPEPGNVINIASISGITYTSQGGQFSYNSTKAATAHLSRMMATEFVRRGLDIRVNVIAPGYFPSHGWGQEDHWLEKYGIPLRRVGNAIDYAQLVISLAVNKYITGDVVEIDGGWLLKQE
ncbi:hypothetical protein A1Q2_00283 [Trichosporon asahii var. asahii CBS 8904]|uniref:Short-chain dehydrogenase n=2 Tax=Trichosporon asahii var. asahii TaxID=189963 RepID=K1W143_TRIAC|nr:hypothetical protein A1Q2_00283 [Trichosporon asahii var. asahii CBS 8904]